MLSTKTGYHDVVIVGAGPSGSVLARELARDGVDVVLLEKARMPRYKTCGGGVNIRTVRLLDIDLSPVAERVIYGGEITYKLAHGFVKRYPEPLTYMTMRDHLDHYLAQQAVGAGAKVLDSQKVNHIEKRNRYFSAHTADHTYRGRILVGADGANSVVARYLGLMQHPVMGVALEAEVWVSPTTLERWNGMVTIDVGSVPLGYGWVFPKKEHLSIGVVSHITCSHLLRPYFQRFLKAQKLEAYEVRQFKGHRLPLRRPGMDIQKGRIILVGDAAGLIDPFSGDGIYYAVKSAQLAAPVVLKAINAAKEDLSEYQDSVDSDLMPERMVSATMLRIFSWMPLLYFQWLKRHELPWRATCKILRGDKTYTDVPERLGPFKFFFQKVRGL